MHIWDGRRSPTLQTTGLDGSIEWIRSYDEWSD
jgi:hypothetical protein